MAGLPGAGAASLEWADFDNDGRLDLLVAWDGFSRIYKNNTLRSNQPPASPTDLLATVQPHNNVVLTWSPATDTETPSQGLSYNLRVGTTSGGSEVMSPDADPATGARRLPSLGNAGHTNRWVLSNLPRGTYYWSVQAIDTGLAGSPFAAEVSLTITNDVDTGSNHPPVALAQSPELPEDTAIPIILDGSDPDGDSLTYAIRQPAAHGTLTGFPPNVTYTPSQDYFGPDDFEFRVRDGLADSPYTKVSITVTPVVDIPDIRVSLAMAFGSTQVMVIGEPYQGYAVEASTNLVDWLTVFSYTNSASSYGSRVSTNGFPWRFFRARTIP